MPVASGGWTPMESSHRRADAQVPLEGHEEGKRRAGGRRGQSGWWAAGTASSRLLLASYLVTLASVAAGSREGALGAERRSGIRINEQLAPSGGAPTSFPPLGAFNESFRLYPTPGGAHYMIDVELGGRTNGSVAHTARLVVDTGSGDIVVFGDAHCTQREGINHVVAGNPCFRYKDSASFAFNKVPTPDRRINANCRFNVDGHIGAVCREALLIDGYKAELQCEMGFEDVRLPGLTGVRADVCIVNDTDTATYKMRYWNNTQGTVGMFYQVCQPGSSGVECLTPYPPLILGVPPEVPHIFTLDLNRPDKESWLHFGEPTGGWVGMEWSETQPIALAGRSGSYSYPYAFHTFEIYHPNLCGADLLSNYSSHWTAMVDTGATCLTLPQEFFDMVLAWVPALDCVPESIPDYDFSDCLDAQCSVFKPITVCYLRDGAQPSDLPTLSFRMSEHGRPLFLPLSGLLINDRPSGRERVCINPADSVYSYQADQTMKYLLYFPKISFGTLALRNLVTAFDMESMSIGMRNKVEYVGDGTTGLCASNAVCVGAQTWYRSMNMCLEPPCDTLYFHEVNLDTHQCQIQPSFLACTVVTLITFTLAEIALSEIYEKLAHKLMANYAVA